MMDFQRQLFVALTLLLVGFGLLMVYSASVTSWPTQFERVYLSRSPSDWWRPSSRERDHLHSGSTSPRGCLF
jgi:sulfite exporter TauE/SafE